MSRDPHAEAAEIACEVYEGDDEPPGPSGIYHDERWVYLTRRVPTSTAPGGDRLSVGDCRASLAEVTAATNDVAVIASAIYPAGACSNCAFVAVFKVAEGRRLADVAYLLERAWASALAKRMGTA